MSPEASNTNCIFCKIAAGELPSDIVYQDEEVIGFRDINPITPIHMLVIPRTHIPSVSDLTEADAPLLGHMTAVANQMAREEGIADSGYRLIINCGVEAGQTVPHLHMHIVGGRMLSWTA